MAETTTKKTTTRKSPAATKPAVEAAAKIDAVATEAAAAVKTAHKSAATSDTSGRPFSLSTLDLSQVDVRALVTDAAYATVGASDFVVEKARELPELAATARKDAQTFVKEAPSKLEAQVTEVLDSAKSQFKGYASRGRKVVSSVTQAPATKRALDQTETARAQVKGAVTSLRKVVETSQDAVESAASRIGLRRSA